MATKRPSPARPPHQPPRPASAHPPKPPVERETSIRRGVEVLLSLAEEETLAAGGLGVTRIAELLGREKSQVSRSLKALSEYGLVERNADSTYRLGWRLYALAALAGERRLLELAAPMMRRIAVTLGERVQPVGGAGNRLADRAQRVAGAQRRAVGWAGRVTPAYCTSAGRALLLDMAPADVGRLFAGVEFVAHGRGRCATPASSPSGWRWRAPRGTSWWTRSSPRPDRGRRADPRREGADHRRAQRLAPRFRFLGRVEEAAAVLTAGAAALSGELGAPELADAAQRPAS